MIERRDFLKVCLAGAAVEAGCRDAAKPANDATSAAGVTAAPVTHPAPAAVPKAVGTNGALVTFRGMCLFVIPARDTGMAEVALVKTEHEGALRLAPHYGTLKIPRLNVLTVSSKFPVVAADADAIYVSLANSVLQILPKTVPAAPDLQIGRDPVSSSVAKCGVDQWSSVSWLLDFNRDLLPGAKMVSNWRTSPALYGRVELTTGQLEKNLGTDGQDHYTYDVFDYGNAQAAGPKTRVLKDTVRYLLAADEIQFKIGLESCTIDARKTVAVTIDHVPATWSKNSADLNDFQALYGLFDPSVLSGLSTRPIPSNRKLCGSMSSQTLGCECCPAAAIFV
jgi:hypothetical protein